MADQFVAEIRIFPFNFAPKGWAFCDGQLMPISQNTALFSLLGTTYGGDGKSTFALPNMQGNAPMQQGQGSGLSVRDLGEMSGVESITLLQSEIPVHSHTLMGDFAQADLSGPTTAALFTRSTPGNAYMDNSTQNLVQMNPLMLTLTGGGLPHNNMQPYLTMNFCIALQGIFPARPVADKPARRGVRALPPERTPATSIQD
ncbi:MAG: phage tail protein [Acidobacteria bacterium]|nr:phage tail protein [Acidobacteriota bacterium]